MHKLFTALLLSFTSIPAFANDDAFHTLITAIIIALIFGFLGLSLGHAWMIFKKSNKGSEGPHDALRLLAEKHAYKLAQNDKEVKRSVALISHELRTTFSEIKMLLDQNAAHRITDNEYEMLKILCKRGLQELSELRYVGLSKTLVVADQSRASVASIVTSAVNEFIRSDKSYFNPNNISIDDVEPVASIPIFEIPLLKLSIVNLLRHIIDSSDSNTGYIKINICGKSKDRNNLEFTIQIITPVQQLNTGMPAYKLSASIIEKVGGNITYTSTETTSRININFVATKSIGTITPEEDSSDILKNSDLLNSHTVTKIVFAEDNTVIRMASEYIFDSLGVPLVSFDNGSDALDYINEHYEKGMVLITDLYMPGLTGFELVKKLKEQDHEIPIAVITAASEGNEFFQISQDGAHTVLEKPLTRNKAARVLLVLSEIMNKQN